MSTTTTTTATATTQQVSLANNAQPQADTHTPAEQDKAFQALARGDRQGVLKLRGIPTFSDPAAKRQWVREHMAAAFRFFGKRGYGEGVSGHISVRGE